MHARISKSHKHILKCMDLHTDALCVYVCLGLGLCFCFSLILFPLFLSLSVYPSVCLSSLWLGNQKVKRTSYNLVSKEALFFSFPFSFLFLSFPFPSFSTTKPEQPRRGSWTKFSIFPYTHIAVCRLGVACVQGSEGFPFFSLCGRRSPPPVIRVICERMTMMMAMTVIMTAWWYHDRKECRHQRRGWDDITS